MIVIEGIKKSFHKQKVLEDVSIVIQPGSCVGIIGRNGCGKSTLLSILAGVEKPTEGRVSFFEKEAIGHANIFEKYVGYVPQTNPLIPSLTVKDNLKFWSNGKEQYDAAVRDYELEDILKKKVHQLSGGMKRRLSIACALANHPPVLIMDEPTSALDIVYKDSVHQLMKQYLSMGGTIILATHEKEEMKLCDICYIMENGSLNKYNVE